MVLPIIEVSLGSFTLMRRSIESSAQQAGRRKGRGSEKRA